ncbi:MAG TPA: hypothetical protein PLJ84_03370 [Bacteroidales bacterium]|nr:hypothetical protein [Bacteroidales bacterium]HPT01611.1 hypothetical protein [Bacteroidales bacterium]
MKTSIPLLAVFAFMAMASFYSCEKSSDSGDVTKDIIINKTSDSVLIFGSNSDSLILTPWDLVLQGYYHTDESAELDIDGDSIADIRLVSSIEGLAGTAPIPASYIKCLHSNVMLRNRHKSDTITMKETCDTVYDNGRMIIQTVRTFECNTYLPGDSITEVREINHIVYNIGGDSVATYDLFESGSYTLASSPYTTPWMTGFQSDSLVITSMGVYNDNCCTMPDDVPVYIGFKIITDGKPRLGWIKLSVHDYSIIHIYETAIQPVSAVK